MKVRQYGRSGLFVPEISIGTATYGGAGFSAGNTPMTEETARACVAMAIDRGANAFDTADGYAQGNSELVLGCALKALGLARRDFLVFTKAGLATGSGANHRGASRANILDASVASLRRLSIDYIDIFHVHLHDHITPIEETVEALKDVVSRGYARYVACSNWQSWRVMKAIGIASQHGWPRIGGIEAYYSLAGRDIEREIVPLIREEGLGLLAYSPLARGALSGKPRSTPNVIPVPRVEQCLAALRGIAQRRGVSSSQIAIAWLLTRAFVSSVLVGASSTEQLADNLTAAEIVLGPEEIRLLDEASALPPEYPDWLDGFSRKQREPAEWRRG